MNSKDNWTDDGFYKYEEKSEWLRLILFPLYLISALPFLIFIGLPIFILYGFQKLFEWVGKFVNTISGR